jgi:hypothetical protein
MSDIMVGARFIRLSFFQGHYGLEVKTSKQGYWIKFGPHPHIVAGFMKANNITHFDMDSTVADNCDLHHAFTLAARAAGLEV